MYILRSPQGGGVAGYVDLAGGVFAASRSPYCVSGTNRQSWAPRGCGQSPVSLQGGRTVAQGHPGRVVRFGRRWTWGGSRLDPGWARILHPSWRVSFSASKCFLCTACKNISAVYPTRDRQDSIRVFISLLCVLRWQI